MPPYNIDVNINFGSASANFQTLIDNNAKLQATIDSLSKTIQDFGNRTTASNNSAKKSIGDYAGSYKNLSSEISNTRKQLIEELSVLEKMRKSRRTSTADVNEQVKAVNKLQREIKEQVSALNQYNKTLGVTSVAAKNTTSAVGSLTKTFNSLGAVLGISFGAYGAFRGLVGMIKTISEFDLAQKKLQSILAETSAGMEVISQSAIDVGKNSIFGAKGVSELQIELAKMGFTKNEIIAMQGAIVNLATATQEELAPSAEIVANVLRAFDLTAGEATMVVDIMGKAFNDSALDLSNFREAIKYVAPIAKQANFTFAETTSLLEQLSNAGIKGSLAGTGLTNIISRLGNENSKFAKTLGRTVDGFDDFIAGLIELKGRGIDITGVFELVDRRAAAVFSILLDGTETVKEFKEKLQDASGVMEEQAAVQLDSIAYRAKLAGESWKAFILEIDSGNGVISEAVKGFLSLSDAIITALGDPVLSAEKLSISIEKSSNDVRRIMAEGYMKLNAAQKDEYDELLAKTREYYGKLDKIQSDYYEKVRNAPQGIAGAIPIAKFKNELKAELLALQKEFPNIIGELASERSLLLTGDSKRFVDYFNDLAKSTGNATKAFEVTIKKLLEFKKTAKEANDTLSVEKYTIAIKKVGDAYEKISGFSAAQAEADSGKVDKTIQNRIKAEIELLELIKKNNEEYIKLQNDGYAEAQKLAENDLEFSKKILEKKLELEIETGANVVEAGKANKLEIENVELKYAAAMQVIAVKMTDDLIKEEERLTKVGEKFSDSVNKNMADNLAEMLKFLAENTKKLEKEAEWKGDNPIWAALGFTSENTEFIDALKEGFDLAKDYITGWADKWVEQTERVVEARNNAVDEAEQALQTEIALAELGFASNVTLKRKQLEEEKKLRDKALVDARKARQAQAQIDTATQLSSLLTAVANIIKGWSNVPLVGSILGVAAAGAMLASFIAFRGKAMAAASTDKFEKGGEITKGRRHSQGGTMIEAEQGEYVVNRRSTLKHKKLIEAINNDDKVSLDKIYLNGLKSSVLSAHVSLDDSQDLKAIRKALEKQGKQVTYFGNYRIEKQGNVTSKILMN